MTSKIVYQTDHVGIFIGTAEADPCPLEEDVWLIPGGCVEIAPPSIPAGKAALWTGDHWELIDNLEGLTAYSTQTGEPRQLGRLEPLPSGFTLLAPKPGQSWKSGGWVDDVPAILAHRYAEQTEAINRACSEMIVSGFSSSALGAPFRYSSELDDQLNLTGAVLRGQPMPYACRDVDGVKEFRLHSAEQLRAVGDDFTHYKLQLLQQADQLKKQLDQALAAGDLALLDAITWSAPQP